MYNFSLETVIGNFSFIVLFLIMIFYWVEIIFSIIPKFNLIIVLITMVANLNLIILLTIRWFIYKHFPLSNLYESLIFLSWSFTLIQLFFLYKKNDFSAAFKLSFKASLKNNLKKTYQTLYKSVEKKLKSVNFFSLLIPLLFFKQLPKFSLSNNVNFSTVALSKHNKKSNFDYLGKNYKLSLLQPLSTEKINNLYTRSALGTNNFSIIIGTILSPITLFINSFATFSLPKNMQKAQALVPALQSNWLMMHVTVMMLSYTALLFGSLLAISFLIIDWLAKKQSLFLISQPLFHNINKNLSTKKKSIYTESNLVYNSTKMKYYDSVFFLKNNKLFLENKNLSLILKHKPLNIVAKTLDNLSYRILGLGFPLLTVGILSGAVWANEAWGSYWSWDPKETWAFITWLVFAIYLHGRIIKGWQGQKPAIVASFGFLVVWVCYLGVNILGTGLHSYGWLK